MDMVERVGRAMVRAGVGELMWDSWDAEMQEVFLRQARAAIEAMREPDQAMQDAGYVVTVDDAVEVWETMIDAALSPNQKG